MFKVNKEKCIGCKLCVKDCFVNDIEMIDNKAYIRNKTCFKCGHCIAICPQKAVFTDEYNMNEVVEYKKDSLWIIGFKFGIDYVRRFFFILNWS